MCSLDPPSKFILGQRRCSETELPLASRAARSFADTHSRHSFRSSLGAINPVARHRQHGDSYARRCGHCIPHGRLQTGHDRAGHGLGSSCVTGRLPAEAGQVRAASMPPCGTKSPRAPPCLLTAPFCAHRTSLPSAFSLQDPDLRWRGVWAGHPDFRSCADDHE